MQLKSAVLSLCGLMFASLLSASAATAEQTRFDIAITIDDLPAHGRLPPGMTRLGIAKTYIGARRRRTGSCSWRQGFWRDDHAGRE